MNVSEFDCPQYVCFESEEFLRDASRLSADSLDSPRDAEMRNLSAISGLLSPTEISQDEKVSMESTRYDSCETSTADQENMGDLSNLTNSFPIMQARLGSGAAKRSTMRVTVPKPFQFQTDNRLKSKTAEDVNKYEQKDFVSELRHNTVLQPHKNVTRPKPFNLTEAKKRKHEDNYLSLAEQVIAFQKKTPERYHSSSNREFQPQAHWSPPKLVAKTPKLQAFKRRRVVQAISKEEQENIEIEQMKAYEFHARPVDPKIYRQPLTLRSQPTMKTRAKDFRLKTTQKAVKHLRNRTKSNKESFVFKARPMPKAMLSGPTGLKEKPVVRLTQAKSPDFVTENRLEKRKIHEQEKKVKEEEEVLKKKVAEKKRTPTASSAPPSVPYFKKLTEMQPFSFDKADQQRFSEKEKRIKEEIEKESKPFVFHAQKILEPPPLPVIPKQPPTEVKPFNFLLDNRVFKSINLSFDDNNTTFKARPATVLNKEPFIPEKPPKQEIEIAAFNLHTDKRASDRQHLKEIKEQEELEMQEALLEQKAREEERERQELMQLRREIVHKANPVRHYKPLELKPSDIPLTQPESPQFATDKRLQKRHDQSSSSSSA